MPDTTHATTQAVDAFEPQPPALLVDGWYSQALAGDGAVNLDVLIALRFGSRWAAAARRFSFVRGALWFVLSLGTQRVVCPFASRGLLSFLALHWLLSTRPPRLYLVEFVRMPGSGLRAHIAEALRLRLLRWWLPRMLAGAQVIIACEVKTYANLYRLPAECFHFIAYPMLVHAPRVPPSIRETKADGVLALGDCDWPSLMAAADKSDWPLTILCSPEERSTIDALNRRGRASVVSETSEGARRELLSNAGICVLALREQHSLSAQVHLAQAIASGVPVVATAVKALEGYAQDGRTALCVPVDDAACLRTAIDTLYQHATLREQLSVSARAALHASSLTAYLEDIRAFVNKPCA